MQTKTLVNNRQFCIKIRPNQAKSGRNQAPISTHGRPMSMSIKEQGGTFSTVLMGDQNIIHIRPGNAMLI